MHTSEEFFYSGTALEATAAPYAHTRGKILNFFMLEQRVKLSPRHMHPPEEKIFLFLEQRPRHRQRHKHPPEEQKCFGSFFQKRTASSFAFFLP
jgi:hypothetical protein